MYQWAHDPSKKAKFITNSKPAVSVNQHCRQIPWNIDLRWGEGDEVTLKQAWRQRWRVDFFGTQSCLDWLIPPSNLLYFKTIFPKKVASEFSKPLQLKTLMKQSLIQGIPTTNSCPTPLVAREDPTGGSKVQVVKTMQIPTCVSIKLNSHSTVLFFMFQ